MSHPNFVPPIVPAQTPPPSDPVAPTPPPRKRGGRGIAAIAVAGLLAISVPFLAPSLATGPAPGAAASAGTSATPNTGTQTDTSTATAATASLTGTVSSNLATGVVLITATTSSGQGAGTGMVLTADGQVLTNYHVVEGSTAIEVTIASTGVTYTASVVGHDASADVALLQLQGASGLATVTLDDDTLAVGDTLTAVGNAQGGGQLVAASGVVTALEQSVTVSGNNGPEELAGVIESNVDAEPGDSGGPMYDAEGEVTGMTTAGGTTVTAAPGGRRGPGTSAGAGANAGSGSGVSAATVTTTAYAVPIDDAMAVVAQIRSGIETDTVRIGARAYLGVSVSSRGLTVVSAVADGPAAAAGVTTGSVITAVNGTTVTTQAQLADVLDALDPGQTVTVAWTDTTGTARSASVTLGASPVN